jgi:bacteriocin biosynthesis cyclodehydratase domain-containing protein
MQFPKIALHWRVHIEAPNDGTGLQPICFTSNTRQVRIRSDKSHELYVRVVPRLSGQESRESIVATLSSQLDACIINDFLDVLNEKLVIYDAAHLLGYENTVLADPALLFHIFESGIDLPSALNRIRTSDVVIWGLCGVAALATWSLAAVGVRSIRLVDANPVDEADTRTSLFYNSFDLGLSRQEILHGRLSTQFPNVLLLSDFSGRLDDDFINRGIRGAQLVIRNSSFAKSEECSAWEQLCRDNTVPWLAYSFDAFDLSIGPVFNPPLTLCYPCYAARVIQSNAGGDATAEASSIQGLKTNPSSYLQGIVANLIAVAAIPVLYLRGCRRGAGMVRVFDSRSMSLSDHSILPRPWCAVCFPRKE